MVVAINELVLEDGVLRARPTGRTETLPAGLVLSSIGYRGRPLAEMPFDERRGLVPNDGGHVAGGQREYVAGWIKRGPSGIIGTNKRCAQQTVERLLADVPRRDDRPTGDETAAWLRERRPRLVTSRIGPRSTRTGAARRGGRPPSNQAHPRRGPPCRRRMLT